MQSTSQSSAAAGLRGPGWFKWLDIWDRWGGLIRRASKAESFAALPPASPPGVRPAVVSSVGLAWGLAAVRESFYGCLNRGATTDEISRDEFLSEGHAIEGRFRPQNGGKNPAQAAKQGAGNGVFGLLAGAWRRSMSKSRRPLTLSVVERITLGPRQSLALVEADGVRLLVATGPEGSPSFFSLTTADDARKGGRQEMDRREAGRHRRNLFQGSYRLPSIRSRPGSESRASW